MAKSKKYKIILGNYDIINLYFICPRSSAGLEHDPPKIGVGSSNLLGDAISKFVQNIELNLN